MNNVPIWFIDGIYGRLRAIEASFSTTLLALFKELRVQLDHGKAALDNLEATARAWQARPEGEP